MALVEDFADTLAFATGSISDKVGELDAALGTGDVDGVGETFVVVDVVYGVAVFVYCG